MKLKLLKKLSFAFALFGALTISAQSFTFDADLEGFTENFAATMGPNGTVVWDADGGAGALKLTRATNNANFGLGSNGNSDASIVGIDADATPIIKIVIKNLTAGRNVRVGAKGEDGTAGNANFNNILTANSGSYETFYLDMTGELEWNGDLTNFWIAIRGNYTGTSDTDAAYINSIELLASIPDPTLDGIVQNPSFEYLDGSLGPWSPANQAYATVAITSDDARSGSYSMTHTYSAVPTGTHFVFNNYIHDLGASFTEDITASLWVKVLRPGSPTSPSITVQGQARTGTTLVVGELTTQSQNLSTSKTDGTWEELTYTFSPAAAYSTAQFRYGLLLTNLQAGDIVYVDDVSANVATLSVGENTIENVSMFPNPASGYVNIKTLEGANVSIYNIVGKLVKSENTLSNEHSMDVSDLSTGIYLVKLTIDGRSATKKLIIK